jgi:hypothetical protein
MAMGRAGQGVLVHGRSTLGEASDLHHATGMAMEKGGDGLDV